MGRACSLSCSEAAVYRGTSFASPALSMPHKKQKEKRGDGFRRLPSVSGRYARESLEAVETCDDIAQVVLAAHLVGDGEPKGGDLRHGGDLAPVVAHHRPRCADLPNGESSSALDPPCE